MAALVAHSAMTCYRSISSSVSILQAHQFDVVRNVREILQPLTDAVIRVYDDAGNVIETQEHAGDS